MPFLEVFDFDATPATRRTATERMTKSLCEAYDIAPDIVSVYFFGIGEDSYAHHGIYGQFAEIKRIFVKVHAFRRSLDARRTAARLLTDAFVSTYGVPEKAVVIYFFDREPDEVAHAGVIADARHYNI